MKKSALLVCAAGLACSSAAFAQSNPEDISSMGQIRLQAPSQGFAGRVLTIVYGAAVDLRGYSDGGFPKRSGDDFDFAGGPAGAVVGNVPVDGAYFGIVTPAGATEVTADVRVTIYDNFTGFTVGTFPGNTPLGNVTFTGIVGTPTFVTFFDGSPGGTPTFTPAINVANNLSGAEGFVTLETLAPGTTNPHPTTWVVTGGPAFAVGTSDPQRWGDSNGDGLVQTTPAEVNGVAAPRRLYMGLRGDAPVQPPTPRESIPCLTDGNTTQIDPIPAAGVKWYEVCLTNGVDDDLLTYLDIDSQGSAVADTNIGLYTADGNLVGFSGLDRGTGAGAQLSFGVGRRAPLGDGEQYDGSAGDLDNSLGTQYYVAVSDGTASFGPAFTVTNVGGAGGSATTNFRTNTVGGANLASVTPEINALVGTAYGVLAAGTNFGIAGVLARDTIDSVAWNSFEITTAVCASGGSLVLDYSLSDDISDVVAWVFDASGNIVAFGDDGVGVPTPNKPDIRFGAGGNSGDLLPGTYYIASALFDADNSDLSTVSGNDRFHVRGRSGSSLNVGANLEFVAGAGPTCGPSVVCNDIDFNNDLALFDPTDIDALLSVFSEGPCVPDTQTCDSVDFNNDGGLFDPCDIASFLLVFQEGPCTACGE